MQLQLQYCKITANNIKFENYQLKNYAKSVMTFNFMNSLTTLSFAAVREAISKAKQARSRKNSACAQTNNSSKFPLDKCPKCTLNHVQN